MRTLATLTIALGLTACSPAPTRPVEITTTSDLLCTLTTRPVVTAAQKAAFLRDEALWDSLVLWLTEFNSVRDSRCGAPPR